MDSKKAIGAVVSTALLLVVVVVSVVSFQSWITQYVTGIESNIETQYGDYYSIDTVLPRQVFFKQEGGDDRNINLTEFSISSRDGDEVCRIEDLQYPLEDLSWVNANRQQLYLPMDSIDTGGVQNYSYDQSSANNTATVHGNVSVVNGVKGDAYYFHNGYLNVPYDTSLEPGNSFAISYFVKYDKPSQIDNYGRIYSRGFQDSIEGSIDAASTGRLNHVYTEPGPNQVYVTTASINLSDGDWHHVVATLGGGWGAIYIDGEYLTGNPVSSLASTTSDYFIGALDVSLNNPFVGTIDEFRFYNQSLNASEIATLRSTTYLKESGNGLELEVSQCDLQRGNSYSLKSVTPGGVVSNNFVVS